MADAEVEEIVRRVLDKLGREGDGRPAAAPATAAPALAGNASSPGWFDSSPGSARPPAPRPAPLLDRPERVVPGPEAQPFVPPPLEHAARQDGLGPAGARNVAAREARA